MKRNIQLSPNAYGSFTNQLLLSLYRCRDFPTRLRILNTLEQILGPKRFQAQSSYGFVMAVDREDLIQRTVLDEGVWEDECSEAIRNELRPDDIFYDVGCNVGYHTLLAISSGARHVVAFDPDPLNCAIFKLNMRLNGYKESRYSINQYALSDQEGTADFFRSTLQNIGRSGLYPRDVVNSFPIKTHTIDQLIQTGQVPIPTVIKLDVEGWEYQVLSGCSQLFKVSPPRCVFFENNPECDPQERESIWLYFEKSGYAITRIENNDDCFHNNYIARLSCNAH